jgi:aminopeptidase N
MHLGRLVAAGGQTVSNRRSIIRTILLASLLAGAAAAPSASGPEVSAPGDGFDVISYALALTPDVQGKTIAGRETIALRATTDGVRRLRFSGNALTIVDAALDGAIVRHGIRDGALEFELAAPLPQARIVRLEISYHGRPARGFAGGAASLYTSYFACDWMICAQDQFGDKATFRLDLRVPAGTTSLSVGRLVEQRPGPDGTVVHRWESQRPYSPYLFGFAMGRFASASEEVGRSRLTYLSDTEDAAGLKRRFAATPDMVAFLADKAGIGLPVAEYSQLLVAGDEAQEAATYSVLGTDAVPVAPGDPANDWAIVHELAHQWWGNLVTCATLEDFWLNEGVTTFMTAAWKEHRYGTAVYEAELEVARKRLAGARAQGFDKPLAWSGRYPSLSLRRAVQYSKGALFMAQLRAVLGERAFWSGLRRYTRAHAGGPVTSVDLQRAMQVASGRDLLPLFTQWVYGEAPAIDAGKDR